MTDDGLLKKGLGQIGNLGKQIGKGVVDEGKKTAKAVVTQVGLEQIPENQVEKKTGAPEQEKEASNLQKNAQDANANFVKSLYGKTEQKTNEKPASSMQQMTAQASEENPDKSPEEIQKMVQLRQQLHKEKYYDPTFNRPKQEEEKPQERVERLEEEEKKKKMELMEKKEKKKPVAVGIAEKKIEVHRGASG